MSEPRALVRTPTQPGLEVVPDGQDGPQLDLPEKEAVQQQWSARQPEKEVVEPLTGPDMQSFLPARGSHGRRRLCGLRRKVFWILMLVIALLVAVGLGVGLGVGFGLSSGPEEAKANMPESRPTTTTATTAATSQDSPDAAETSASAVAKALRIGGSLDRSYFSQEGVWNGSGIACNWQSFASNYGDAPEDGESPVVYYQHRGGAIRWMRYTTKGEWARGSSDSEIVASDAKNSTPISAVSYDVAGIQHRHIFCKCRVAIMATAMQGGSTASLTNSACVDIDQNYQVRQRSGSNATTDWTDGTINQEALQTYRGDLVGLHACIDSSDTAAMRLWYASDDTTFEEYAFTNDAWAWQRSWRNYSGAAGVGCYSWGTDNYTYASFVNLDNTLELWYKEKTDMDPNGWHQSQYPNPIPLHT
jgi:hypothetical protein